MQILCVWAATNDQGSDAEGVSYSEGVDLKEIKLRLTPNPFRSFPVYLQGLSLQFKAPVSNI